VDTSDFLETILSHLSTRVMSVIMDGACLQELDYLLEFLAAWEERPAYLTPMAYQWCSAISEAAGTHELGPLHVRRGSLPMLRHRLEYGMLIEMRKVFRCIEEGFSKAGRRCDSLRLDDISHHAHRQPQGLTPNPYYLLPAVLEIGFRLVTPGRAQPALRLNPTPHHDRMFETAFSSRDDDVIADVMSVWIVGDWTLHGSCVRYLAKRMAWDRPFSPLLRRASTQVIERIWYNELKASVSGTVQLLNHLDVEVDDMAIRDVWVRLLVEVICLPAGLESLSSHYWHLLDKLALGTDFGRVSESRIVGVMGLLEKAGDWEKLEVWMVVVWQSLSRGIPTYMIGNVGPVTLRLLLQRPSAILRFEGLCERGSLQYPHKTELGEICDQTRGEQLRLGSPLPPYVSVCLVLYLSILMP
jgi:hypothetical protein